MNKFYIIIIFGIIIASSEENYDYGLEPHIKYKVGKSYTSKTIDYPLNIDGLLSEECWDDLNGNLDSDSIIDDFLQVEPDNLNLATFKTQVKIIHDYKYIYIAAKLFDPNPLEIISYMSRRDDWDLTSSDSFLIEFDSMHDHQTSYFFGVNALGTQIDGVSYLDSEDDPEYNAIWESAVNIDGNGWTLEMKIPFKMLSITQLENPWGMNIHRSIPRLHEYDSWVALPQDIPGVASQFGHIFGFEDINIGSALEIKPYFLIDRNSIKNILLEDDYLYSNLFKEEGQEVTYDNLGVDLKYRLSEASVVDISINPDFSQIEMDPEHINLSYYPIYLPEKRTFFNETETIFDTPIELFYSRRIGILDSKINSAYKIKGHSYSGIDYGIVVANTRDDSTKFSLWDDTGGKFYAFRIKDFNISNIPYYFGVTALQSSNSKVSSIISLDNSIYLFDGNFISEYQYVKNNSQGSEEFGYYYNASYFSKFPIFFNFNTQYYSKNLDLNQMGFLYRNNIKSFDYNIGLKKTTQTFSYIRKFKIDIYRSIHRNLKHLKIKDNIGTQFNMHLSNYSRCIIGYFFEQEHYDDYYMYDYEEESNGPAFLLPQINRFYLKFNTDYTLRYASNLFLSVEESTNSDNRIELDIDLTAKISSDQKITLHYHNTIIHNKYDFLESVFNDINPSAEDSTEYIFSDTNSWEKRYGLRFEQYFSNKLSIQLYIEYLKLSNEYGNYKLWDADHRWPTSNSFIDGGITSEGYGFDPLYTEDGAAPAIVDDVTEQYLDPNYYVGFYPRYSSLNLNLSLKYEYRPGSEFYFVYALSKAINGRLFDSIKDFILYTDKDDWTERYFAQSFYLKFSYWFDI